MDAFLKVALIGLLAVMSPGPDFVMITKNSLGGRRLAGVFSALGLGAGILVHVAYCLTGIAIVLMESPQLLHAIKIVGGIYLIWIGYQALTSSQGVTAETKASPPLGNFAAFRMGLLTNALNPKATLFIFSLFTQIIDPSTSLRFQFFYGLEIATITTTWFAFVALLFSHPLVHHFIRTVQRHVDRLLGAVLVTWGLALFLMN